MPDQTRPNRITQLLAKRNLSRAVDDVVRTGDPIEILGVRIEALGADAETDTSRALVAARHRIAELVSEQGAARLVEGIATLPVSEVVTHLSDENQRLSGLAVRLTRERDEARDQAAGCENEQLRRRVTALSADRDEARARVDEVEAELKRVMVRNTELLGYTGPEQTFEPLRSL